MRARTYFRGAVVLAATIAAAACGRTEWTMTVQPLAAPSGPNPSSVQLTGRDESLILSWIEQTDEGLAELKFARRAGAGWSASVTAASGTDWFISFADVPSVMRLGNGTLVAQWLQTTAEELEAYDLRVAYSKDEGKTWSAPFTPHDDGTKTQHGFASLFELPGNALGLVWLDGRAGELERGLPKGGDMAVRYASFDANWKQTADAVVDRRVCECCQTSAVVTSEGVLTAYRDRTEGEIRDIVVARLQNGNWSPPTVVHNDNWEVYACPVNGPALSARSANVAAAWFTVKEDRGQAWAALSSDAGRSWSAPTRLDDGESLGRVDVEMLEDGTAVVSWVELIERRGELRMRRVEASGEKSPPITVAPVGAGRASSFPHLARHGRELVFAWTAREESGQRLHTASAALPH